MPHLVGKEKAVKITDKTIYSLLFLLNILFKGENLFMDTAVRVVTALGAILSIVGLGWV